MNLKTVEEYSKEMTRPEFDNFTELEELCPNHFGLKDTFEGSNCSLSKCKECYDKALVGIEFKAEVPGLPKEIMPALLKLQELEIQSKAIKEESDKLKTNLLEAMEQHGITKWDNDVMTITYVAASVRSSVDSKKLLKDYPEIYSEVIKKSNVKSSIRIKLK